MSLSGATLSSDIELNYPMIAIRRSGIPLSRDMNVVLNY